MYSIKYVDVTALDGPLYQLFSQLCSERCYPQHLYEKKDRHDYTTMPILSCSYLTHDMLQISVKSLTG